MEKTSSGVEYRTSAAKRKASRKYGAKVRQDPAYRERQRQYMKWWRGENADRKKAADSEYQKKNLEKIRLRRKKWKSKRYEDAVANLVKNHSGRCDICGGFPDGRWKRLNIDHCHRTKVFRGMLCKGCNQGLGLFKDDPTLLRKAVKYLQDSRKRRKKAPKWVGGVQ